MIWLLPVGVALVMALPIGLALRRVARECRMLSRSIATLVELREPVLDLGTSIRGLREGVPLLAGRTRPGSSTAP